MSTGGVTERLSTAGFDRIYVQVDADGTAAAYVGPGVMECKVRPARRGLWDDTIAPRIVPKVYNKHLYVALSNSGVVSVDPDTGEIIGHQDDPRLLSTVCSTPEGEGYVSEGSTVYDTYRFDRELESLATFIARPDWTHGQIVHTSFTPDRSFLALTAKTLFKYDQGGTLLWELPLGGGSYNARRLSVVASGDIYVCGEWRHTQARAGRWRISPAGEIVWRHVGNRGGEPIRYGQSVVAYDESNLIFIGCEGRGSLAVYSASDGSPSSYHTVGEPVPSNTRTSNLALGGDGLLYMPAGKHVVKWDISSPVRIAGIYTSSMSDAFMQDVWPLPDGGFVYLGIQRTLRRVSSDYTLLWEVKLPGGNTHLNNYANIASYPARYETFPEAW